MDLKDFDQSKCGKFDPNSTFTGCKYYAEQANDPRKNGFCTLDDMYRCVAATSKVIPLSHSSVQDFLTCHHLYYLKAIRGIQIKDTEKSSPLKMGTLMDKALQKHLGGIIKDDDGNIITIPEFVEKNQIDPYDVAKVYGIYRAYKFLEIEVDTDCGLQTEINLTIPFEKTWGDGSPVELLVTGFYDRKYANSFVEGKFTSKPDLYMDTFFINSQVGTYFLADPAMESCIMEIIRVPQLKVNTKNSESSEEFAERIYQDAISRPSFYFIGWNPKTHRFGKKYFRSEFNLEELKSRYLHIFREIFDARIMDGWYKNDKSCNNVLPGISCDMLGICRCGNNFNNSTYQIRKKKTAF